MATKQQVLESGKGARRNIRTTIAGKNVVHDLTVEPLHNAAGAIVGITCAALDVIEQQCRVRTDADANRSLASEKMERTYDKPT